MNENFVFKPAQVTIVEKSFFSRQNNLLMHKFGACCLHTILIANLFNYEERIVCVNEFFCLFAKDHLLIRFVYFLSPLFLDILKKYYA